MRKRAARSGRFGVRLTAINLVSLGIGGIIGAGIFVLSGHAAAANAGACHHPVVSLRRGRLRVWRPLLCRVVVHRADLG